MSIRTAFVYVVPPLVLGFSCLASANDIVNGSFELPASSGAPSLPVGSTYLDGWTVINAEIAQLCSGCFGIVPSDGAYSLDLAGYHDASPYGGVQQTVATVPNATYTLSFDVGAMNGTSAIEVSAGGLNAMAFSSSTGNAVNWTRYSANFVATAQSTVISLVGTQASAGTTYVGLDNVVLAAVPEADTWVMMMAGLGLIGIVARRRKCSQV